MRAGVSFSAQIKIIQLRYVQALFNLVQAPRFFYILRFESFVTATYREYVWSELRC